MLRQGHARTVENDSRDSEEPIEIKILFLDIDGVCNRHDVRDFEPSCIAQLNRIIADTEARVVISSMWRYLMIDQEGCPKSMTISGFATMLITHGTLGLMLIGHTGPDELFDARTEGARGKLIRLWLKEHRGEAIERYVVLDDDDDGITAESLPFVHCDGNVGLTEENADEAIRILNRE